MLPSAGTGGLEGLDDVAKAPLHGFEHLYHTVEMVRHTNTGMYRHAVAMGGLDLWGLVPDLLHGLAERGEGYCFATVGIPFATEILFATDIGREMGQQVRARGHHKCDEICSATIVVVTRIARSI